MGPQEVLLFLDWKACGFYYAKNLKTSLIALNYNTPTKICCTCFYWAQQVCLDFKFVSKAAQWNMARGDHSSSRPLSPATSQDSLK